VKSPFRLGKNVGISGTGFAVPERARFVAAVTKNLQQNFIFLSDKEEVGD